MEARDLIAIALAVMAFLNLTLAWRRDRRRIRIERRLKGQDDEGGFCPALVCFDVVNLGIRPVVVSAPVLQTQDGRVLGVAPLSGSDAFPKRLGDGETATVRLPLLGILAALRQAGMSEEVTLVPVCTDGVGNTYQGDPWQLNIRNAPTRSACASVARPALR